MLPTSAGFVKDTSILQISIYILQELFIIVNNIEKNRKRLIVSHFLETTAFGFIKDMSHITSRTIAENRLNKGISRVQAVFCALKDVGN